MAAFRPISFDQWREVALANFAPTTEVDCPDCHGVGHCECDSCGHDRECDTCDSTGKVTWDELSDAQKNRLLTREAYAQAVLRDARAWASWLGRDAMAELVSAGFRVWSEVRSRQLRVSPGGAGALQ